MALLISDSFAQLRLNASAIAACILFVVLTDNALIHIGYAVSPVEQRVEFSIRGVGEDRALPEVLQELIHLTGFSRNRNSCAANLGMTQNDLRFHCQFSSASFDAWIDEWKEFSSALERANFAPIDLAFEDKSRLSIPTWLLLAYCLIYIGMSQVCLREMRGAHDLGLLFASLRTSPLPITACILAGATSLLAAGLFALLSANENAASYLEFSGNSRGPTEETGVLRALFHVYLLKLLLLAPLLEESLFRGWLYKRKSDHHSFVASAFINAWAFTCAHAVPLVLVAIPWISASQPSAGLWVSWMSYLAAIFLNGCLLFYIRDRFNSVTLCILAHAAINATALLAIAVILSGQGLQ